MGSGGEIQDGWERIKEHTLHSASGKSLCPPVMLQTFTLNAIQ